MAADISSFLTQHGQSVTAPRLAVYAYLRAHDPTTTAGVIAAQAGAFDRATVYRTLGLFRELGVIQDIVAGGRRMIELTDAFDSHHHHLSCVVCGAVEVIEDERLERRLDEIAAEQGFEPGAHQIELNGRCAKCL
jgi:Fur family ferric uptake transcriptional regulator